MSSEDLIAALNGTEVEEPVAPEATPQATGEVEGEPPSPEPEVAPQESLEEDKAENTSPIMVPKQRLDQVLDKVRAAELERARLEERLKIYESQKQTEPQQAQPEDAFDYGDIEGSVKRYIERETSRLRQEHQQEKLAMSVDAAKRRYNDYDEVHALMMQEASKPGKEWMVQEIMQSVDPAEAMYQRGKQLQQIGDARSIEDLRASIERELEAKVEKRIRERIEAERAQGATTLAAGSSARAPSTDTGTLSIREILGR